MRGTSLGELLRQFRAEARLSTNPAHNATARDAQVIILQRVQETLWEDYDWPHLRVRRDMPVSAGQRYYDPPDDIAIDRIERLEFRFGTEWAPLYPGINAGHYAAWDSDADIRSWPVERWQIYEGGQIELWPIPSDNTDVLEGQVRVVGVRKLSPLIADGDTADLDDRLIVLYAAAENLASRGEKDAKLKLDMATKRLVRLRGNLTKRKQFRLGLGKVDDCRHRPSIPKIHYRTTS